MVLDHEADGGAGASAAAAADAGPPRPQLAFRRKSIHARRPPEPTVASAKQPTVLASTLESHQEVLEALPQIRSVPFGETRDVLIIKKLKQCERVFSFTHDRPADAYSKQVKRNNLIELNEVMGVPQTHGGPTICSEVLEAIVSMVQANILRDLEPPTLPDAPAFDPEEETYYDRRWPHLQHVYALLAQVLDSPFMKAPFTQHCISRAFIRQKLQLFCSYDKRERDALKNVLHRVYAKMISYRSYIRSLLTNMYLRHIYDRADGGVQGVGEMLEISGSIISGFALPIKAEHITFLRKVLMPLHGTAELETYHAQLAYCVLQFVQKSAGRPAAGSPQPPSESVTNIVMDGLLRYWPKCNSTKEVMFMNEFEEVIDALREDSFERCRPAVMRRVARCIGSMHFQVVERALVMLHNPKLMAALLDYADDVFLPVLRKQVDAHWCKQVRERIQACLNYLDVNKTDDIEEDDLISAEAVSEAALAEAAAAEEAAAVEAAESAAEAAAAMDLTPQPWHRGIKRSRPNDTVNGNGDADGPSDEDVNGIETAAKWRRLKAASVGTPET
eukprot:CAMPEP_0182918936 /NCGR_PEP_ID=MMETSP0105_2-20130417/2379_1 /TAXON_ID=81532 ORGANISM="Acanthoeca-like sp., Strain 10tr" /NCGR_SAMPLE_ID=MMETSP0105_2 /ASSEMBLY_ACC=CAM_ASM_000205 /LENGTH=559 /DNA_ID=CAMNT_0025056061 /DNA_START=227 /DNA_END=1906 /DNA_ORIENTATION=-